MKKTLTILLAVIMIATITFSITACGEDEPATTPTPTPTATPIPTPEPTPEPEPEEIWASETFSGATFEIPPNWRNEESGTSTFFYPTKDASEGFLQITVIAFDHADDVTRALLANNPRQALEDFTGGFENQADFISTDFVEFDLEISGFYAVRYDYTRVVADFEVNTLNYFVVVGARIYGFAVVITEDSPDSMEDIFDRFISSIVLEGIAVAATEWMDVSFFWISLEVPSNWESQRDGNVLYFYHPDRDASIMLQFQQVHGGTGAMVTDQGFLDANTEMLNNALLGIDVYFSDYNVADGTAIIYFTSAGMDCRIFYIAIENFIYMAWLTVIDGSIDNIDEIFEVFDRVVDSIEVTRDRGTEATTDSGTAGIDWREFLRLYEAWVDDYIDLLERYHVDPTDPGLMTAYFENVQLAIEWAQQAEQVQGELSGEDLREYIATVTRIAQRLADAMVAFSP